MSNPFENEFEDRVKFFSSALLNPHNTEDFIYCKYFQ